MANKKFKKMTSIKETEGGDFGNYQEAKGGGSPKGGVWGGQSGRVGWDNRERAGEVKQGEHREDQPRTSDGKFTYNSTNGKETKYESRGETVNPLLTGGVNGIKIDDVKNQFKAKSGNLYDRYKDKFFQAGSELITKEGRKYKIKIANDDVWEIARRSFDAKKGEFVKESETFDKSKSGRHSKAETAAIAGAKKAGEQQFVRENGDAIKQKAGAVSPQRWNTGITFQLSPGVLARFRKMQQVANTLGGTVNVPGAGAPANGPATQLLGGQKANLAVNPNLLSTLGGIATKFSAQPVAQQKPQAKPNNVNLANVLGKLVK